MTDMAIIGIGIAAVWIWIIAIISAICDEGRRKRREDGKR